MYCFSLFFTLKKYIPELFFHFLFFPPPRYVQKLIPTWCLYMAKTSKPRHRVWAYLYGKLLADASSNKMGKAWH